VEIKILDPGVHFYVVRDVPGMQQKLSMIVYNTFSVVFLNNGMLVIMTFTRVSTKCVNVVCHSVKKL